MPDTKESAPKSSDMLRLAIIQLCIKRATLEVLKENRPAIVEKAIAYLKAENIEVQPEDVIP